MTISATDIPVIPRGVRLHHDRVRARQVLLAPERTITLDAIGHAILLEVDGQRSVTQIAAQLAQKYQAPETQISNDVIEFLNSLLERRFLEIAS